MTLIAFRDPVSAWTHCAWLVLSIPATYILWRRSAGDRARQISMLFFGMGLAACYAGSTLFHGVNLNAPQLDLYDRIDHIGIYLLIAGSYTPLAFNMMRHHWRVGVLVSAWATALAGSALLVFQGVLPPVLATSIYLVMGWGAIFCYLELLRFVGHRTLFPLLLGGMFYSVGAFLNLMRWPILWRGVFGAHEIFHLFVMAGSLSHFLFVLNVVVPHPRPARPASLIVARERKRQAPIFGRQLSRARQG